MLTSLYRMPLIITLLEEKLFLNSSPTLKEPSCLLWLTSLALLTVCSNKTVLPYVNIGQWMQCCTQFTVALLLLMYCPVFYQCFAINLIIIIIIIISHLVKSPTPVYGRIGSV